MSWRLRQNDKGRPYLEVEYDSTAHNWDAAIAAALAGSGMKRNQLACIICAPAVSTKTNNQEDLKWTE